MGDLKNVALLFGGKSPEHNISILSAKNIFDAIDRSKYNVTLIYITRAGVWNFCPEGMKLTDGDDPKKIAYSGKLTSIYIPQSSNDRRILSMQNGEELSTIDVFFPVLHGNFGEDGSVQGFAKLTNTPMVGCGILGSAVGMDKDIVKRILRDAGIGIADFITLRKGYNENLAYDEVKNKLGSELFVKPANLGSSIGVTFTTNEEEYKAAVELGFKYDAKVIVESKVKGREIECAVLGNEEIEASAIGEILPKSTWYNFENKYVDDDGAKLAIPAHLSQEVENLARITAIETYRVLECRGLTRVDMFLLDDNTLIVNEINTLPGFTKISMYPKLWEVVGLSYSTLVTKLIELAFAEHAKMDAMLL